MWLNSQICALACPAGVDYVRNGTVSIVGALQVATGQVVAEPITCNDSVTFTGFLHRLAQCIARTTARPAAVPPFPRAA